MNKNNEPVITTSPASPRKTVRRFVAQAIAGLLVLGASAHAFASSQVVPDDGAEAIPATKKGVTTTTSTLDDGTEVRIDVREADSAWHLYVDGELYISGDGNGNTTNHC